MKPKLGLLLFTAQWFADIGATGGAFAELPGQLDADAAEIVAALTGAGLDVLCPGVLGTRAQVRQALDTFVRETVDAIVVCQITWGEDWLLLAALDAVPGLGRDMPLLVWCYVPDRTLPDPMSMVDLFRFSGPVGTLQASGPLKRRGVRYSFVYGTHRSPETVRRIATFARAAAVARSLKGARIGLLPTRCDQMSGTWIDEARLRADLGPEVVPVSVQDYRAFCDAVPEDDVDATVEALQATYRIAPAVTPKGLRAAARAALGLAALVAQHDLNAVAIEDVGTELHRGIGLRPCVSVELPGGGTLFDHAVYSMEGDVGAAVALLILRRFTDLAPMYTEVFTVDLTANTLLVGHAGLHDAPALVESSADILIEPDGEYVESEPDSAWMRFRAKGGDVTLLNLFGDLDGFRLTVATGHVLTGPVQLLGSPHAVVRLHAPLPTFFECAVRTGVTQHWAMVHADVVRELRVLAEILGLRFAAFT